MITTYGQAEVARWCGVEPNTVAMWISRYDSQSDGDPDRSAGWPVPDAIVRTSPDHKTGVIRGWLPERKDEWQAYATRRAASPGAKLVALRKDRHAQPETSGR